MVNTRAKNYDQKEDSTKYQRLFLATIDRLRAKEIERIIISNEKSIDYICSYLPLGMSVTLLGLVVVSNIFEPPYEYFIT